MTGKQSSGKAKSVCGKLAPVDASLLQVRGKLAPVNATFKMTVEHIVHIINFYFPKKSNKSSAFYFNTLPNN